MKWFLRILIAVDQLGNAIAGGYPDAVISARVGYFANKADSPMRAYWQILEWIINCAFYPIDGPNHCLCSLNDDKEEKFIHGNDFARAILGLIIIAACIFIAIILRIIVIIVPSSHYKFKLSKLKSNNNES
ncbi:hypothetical protein MNBD_GAMMA22-285 [hydrothermal vent metagenome]|uniref:Uncharacterized protein n=1 Tax=hydrothermal vent metagenome TaxID=652676 RepID=A0A3B0ZBN8_9ZZZZ